jgi:UDP-N-acetylglucosamine--N-acetylmuramyl-(pentapeptide) pyrophosphoryl-undecaprenol N-acetylglucosamine transferase
MRIIVSGGGTGGHISPVLAVVGELSKLDKTIEFLYIGSEQGMEAKIIPQVGIKYVSIHAGKFRRYHANMLLNLIDPTTIYRNVVDFFRFVRGYFEAKEIIGEFDPDVVFCKGGYVSLPVGLAAHSLKYPLVIHESDSVMGLANKTLAKRADKVCVSYPAKSYPEVTKEQLVYTGNPVRTDIYDGSKERALENFNLTDKMPVIMVIGGSQGALVINQAISESLKTLLEKYQVLHVAGERDYDWLSFQSEKLDPELKKRYSLHNFLSGELADAYSVADLVISRAGNNIIAELAALKKPTILIPLASSANGHQLANAKILSRLGAAMLVLQENLSPTVLIRKIDYLFENPEEMKGMSEKIGKISSPDAAYGVAKTVFDLGEEFAKATSEVTEGESEDQSQEW